MTQCGRNRPKIVRIYTPLTRFVCLDTGKTSVNPWEGIADFDELGDDNQDALLEENDSGDEYIDTYFQDIIKQDNTFEEEKVSVDGTVESTDISNNQSYMERSKLVGRLGPPKTELDVNSAVGEIEIIHDRIMADNDPSYEAA